MSQISQNKRSSLISSHPSFRQQTLHNVTTAPLRHAVDVVTTASCYILYLAMMSGTV